MKFFYLDCFFNLNIININSLIFNFKFFNLLFFQYINSVRSNLRLFTNLQKNRSMVNFSTRKLYKQKGTGRARVGSSSSPTRKGGARAFPSVFNQNYKCKINKSIYNYSLKIIFFQYYLLNSFILIEDFFLINFNFFFFKNKFFNFIFNNNSVLLTFFLNKKIFFFFKNLRNFKIFNILSFNILLLLKFSKIYISRSSLSYFFNLLF